MNDHGISLTYTAQGLILDWAGLKLTLNTTQQVYTLIYRKLAGVSWERILICEPGVSSAVLQKVHHSRQADVEYKIELRSGTYSSIPVEDMGGAVWNHALLYTSRPLRPFQGFTRPMKEQYKAAMCMLTRTADTDPNIIPGMLIRPLTFGQRCLTCVGREADLSVDVNCPHCFGSGFELGMSNPVYMYGLEIASKATPDLREAPKNNRQEGEYGVVMQFPALINMKKGAIWYNSITTECQIFAENPEMVSHINRVPVMYQVRTVPLPPDHAIYSRILSVVRDDSKIIKLLEKIK